MNEAAPLPDVFTAGLRLPETVCILAPGPNGREHYERIPPHACVIAVAKAVLIPGVRAGLWMMTHGDQPWYTQADAAFQGVRVYSREAAGAARPSPWGRPHCYSFEMVQDPLEPDVLRPVDGLIRLGGTISGCALQLAYNLGAREILLCGVDMAGEGYWDGTTNVQPMHGDTWMAAANLDFLIRWMMEAKGLKVASLSPTRLKVPAVTRSCFTRS